VKFSIYLKIGVTLVISVLLGVGIVSYLVVSGSKNSLQQQIESEQLQVAQQTMDKLDRFLYERQVDIQTFSRQGQLSSMLANETAGNKFTAFKDLQSLKTFDAVWGDLSVIDAHGATLISTNTDDSLHGVLQEDPELNAYYQRAMQGEVVSTDLIKVSEGSETLLFFMAPIRDSVQSSQVTGVIEGELAWPAALEILNSLHDYDAALINSKGLLLGSNAATEQNPPLSNNYINKAVLSSVKKSTNGSAILPSLSGPSTPKITSHTREEGYLGYKGNGWSLILQTPTETASDPGERLAAHLLVPFLTIQLLTLIFLMVMLNRFVLKPVIELDQLAKLVSEGNFSQRAKVRTRDEIGRLSAAYNDMTEKLQFAYNSLRVSTHEAQNERHILETILNNLPVGVFVVGSPSGQPILLNEAGEKIFGFKLADRPDLKVNAQSHDFIVKEDGSPYPGEELPLDIAVKTGNSVIKDDLYILHSDGAMIAIRASAAPIKHRDGSYSTAVVVFEDISKERSLERTREEFFSIASHELRTPLSAIRGNSSMIQQYYADALSDPSLKEMIGDIHESSVRLIEIVNDFLDTSRLEQKRMKFQFEPLDVVEVARATIKEYQVTGSRQKIGLEVKPPEEPLPQVLADKNRTKQVLINLIGNALKFTSEGSVTVHFASDDDFVKVLVTDTGRGMDADAQKLLFKKFEQTGDTVLTRDSVRGTGLGLYISKLIMNQMHGRIDLESSEPGKGTTFSFMLPVIKDGDESTPRNPHILGDNIT
jgi:signal transduction histidine kinase/HAMP domain-containing protein